ncbi:hypothetical protein BDQ17DRAFT_1367708 [Cyathus striatus]|nr:hypothetical protein BDQ17DRAFT_1367708 [Cyathus striatus]
MIITILRTTFGVPDAKCNLLIKVETWLMVIGMVTAEAIFTTRTWAVCGNKKWLGGVLLVLFIGIGVAIFVGIAQFLNSMTITLQHSILPSCLITNSKSSFFTIVWGLLFVFDVVNLGLLVVPAYYSFRQGPSNLMRLVIREGLTYYIYIFVVASATIVIAKSMTSDYSPLLAELGQAFHSIFACRVVLHTREEARKTQIATDTRMLNLETGDQLLFAPPALLNTLSSHCEV